MEDTPKQECEQCGEEYSTEKDHCPNCEGGSPAGEGDNGSWKLRAFLYTSLAFFTVIWLVGLQYGSPIGSFLGLLFTPVYFLIALLSVRGIISESRVTKIIGWLFFTAYFLFTILLFDDVLLWTTYDLPMPLDRWYYSRNIAIEANWLNFPYGRIKEINSMRGREGTVLGEILFEPGEGKSFSIKRITSFANDNGWKLKEKHELKSQHINKALRRFKAIRKEGEPSRVSNSNLNYIAIDMVSKIKSDGGTFWIRDDATFLKFDGDYVSGDLFVIVDDDQRRMAVYIMPNIYKT